MTARELITKTAEEAGFVNKATDSESRYYNMDEFKLSRRYLRINYDGVGRVRSATWGNGSKTRRFIGKDLKTQIITKIAELTR